MRASVSQRLVKVQGRASRGRERAEPPPRAGAGGWRRARRRGAPNRRATPRVHRPHHRATRQDRATTRKTAAGLGLGTGACAGGAGHERGRARDGGAGGNGTGERAGATAAGRPAPALPSRPAGARSGRAREVGTGESGGRVAYRFLHHRQCLESGLERGENEARGALGRRMAGRRQAAWRQVDARASLAVHERLLARLGLAVGEQGAHAPRAVDELGDEGGDDLGVHLDLGRVGRVYPIERHRPSDALAVKVERPCLVVLWIARDARADRRVARVGGDLEEDAHTVGLLLRSIRLILVHVLVARALPAGGCALG